jgi:hypothetical protein
MLSTYTSVIFAILYVKHITALQYISGMFERDMGRTYPDDGGVYIESLGLSRIECCRNCHLDGSKCGGVLYNRNLRKCKLIKRCPTETNADDNTTANEWEYFRNTGGRYSFLMF